MKKYAIEMFGRNHTYTLKFELESDIATIKILMDEYKQPQILEYSGLDVINIYIENDKNFLANDSIRWIFSMRKPDKNDNDIRQYMLDNSIEDTEWTTNRNKDLTGVYYRKITFKSEIQEFVIKQLSEYLKTAENMILEWEHEDLLFEENRKADFAQYTITTVHTKIMPKGGENGVDGYFDADITNNTNTTRFVARNVFDFGFYTYPKRVEGTNEVFERDGWTLEELAISKWLRKFSPFSTEIRM